MVSPMRRSKGIFLHIGILSILIFICFFPMYRQSVVAESGHYFPLVHGRYTDYYSYLSYIRQGSVQWYQTNQYSTADDTRRWTHAFYLILGRVSSLLHLSPPLAYHGALLLCLIVWYIYTVKLVNIVLAPTARVWAWALIFFAGPFPPPLETAWWTKMDLYNRVSLIPHHFFSVALLIAASYYLVRYYREGRKRWLVCCLVVQTIGTLVYNIPEFLFTVAVCLVIIIQVIRWKKIGRQKNVSGIFLIVFMSLMVQVGALVMYQSAGATGINARLWEYELHRPEVYPAVFSVYLQSYGILWLGVLASVGMFWKKEWSPESLFLFGMTVLPIIFYLLSIGGVFPVNKLRFVDGAPYVYAGLLAAGGLEAVVQRLRVGKRKFLMVVVLVLIGIQSVISLRYYWWPLLVWTPPQQYDNMYIPQDYLKAVSYMDSHSPRYTPVLAPWSAAPYIPAVSFLRVYMGHETATDDFPRKWKEVESFYRATIPMEEARQLVRTNHLVYVLWDATHLAPGYDTFLDLEFTSGKVKAYRVRQ